MSVPDHSAIIDELFETGHYTLTTHEGLAAFVDACVIALHSQDHNWGHLKKKPGQTQIHGHAEDAALYKKPDGTAQAVDFVSGAGGPNPQPGWHVDTFVYKHADWLDPADHDGPSVPPPSSKPYPGDEVWDAVGVTLFADYHAAHQAPNPQMGRWFGRTIWDATEGDARGTVLTIDASIKKHRAEWRAVLGLPPI